LTNSPMAAEESIETPMNGPAEDTPVSKEQVALTDFAHCLGSCNFTVDSGIADDECSTRKEAKLLMSLLASPPHLDQEELELVSSSESELSYSSDSSHSRRETFTFTCPSLSLENSSSKCTGRRSLNLNLPQRRVSDMQEEITEEMMNVNSIASSLETPLPADLLKRPLTVDDRDALRLSADAMARNVLQSFQKALDWRIQAWIDSASATLVKKEREMVSSGASEHEIRGLLETGEAKLIITLRAIADQILVTGVDTSFRVLSQRVESDCTSSETTASEEPVQKKRRIATKDPSDLEEGEYNYGVTHSLMFEVVVHLQTPAGYSEINLQVPGSMDGTFLSSEPGAEELKAVLVELDTNILSAMVEKACRTIVRTSFEAAMKPAEVEPMEEEAEETAATTSPENMMSPPRQRTSEATAEAIHATMITPSSLFSDTLITSADFSANKRVLLPIPDDLDKYTTRPRQISPQPQCPDFNGSVPFMPRKNTGFAGASLVSPAPNNETAEYVEGISVDKGPSLPMLVEVACRAMLVD
jgi:hypothetical protein